MSERLVSPGVFTRERDLSFLIQGISEIGGAFIGPTPKGPAFIPTIVRNGQEYVQRFGEADSNHYLGLTVKNYLRESGIATIVRVLGLDGYDNNSHIPAALLVTGSSGSKVFAVLHPTGSTGTIQAISVSGSATNFTLSVNVPGTAGDFTGSGLSCDENSLNYLGDYLGTSPNTTKGAYAYALFPEAVALAGESASMQVVSATNLLMFSGSTWGRYRNATTPWIKSQTVGGQNYDLFRVHTLSDGTGANKELKISILAIKKSTDPDSDYGTFTLLVRKYDDLDSKMEILEQYDNLTLDPNSANYIARVIGNSVPTEDQTTGEIVYQGDFPNRSKYIRVEMSEAYAPATALPFGFGQYYAPVAGFSANQIVPPTYVNSRWQSGSVMGWNVNAIDKKYYYGWDFSDTEGTNPSYLNAIPSGALQVGSAFNLENLIEVPNQTFTAVSSISLDDDLSFPYRKFSVAFQGGFDGMNPARSINLGESIVPSNTQGFDLTTATSPGSKAYKKALDAISNPEALDINLLVMPGVIYELHSYVADLGITVCESRGDAFYIMDLVQLTSGINNAVLKAGEIDTNYAATYYPWLRVIDTNTNRLLWVPPSVVLPEIYAYNDNVAAEWFAPAGLNRGGISAAVGVKVRLPQAARDDLYEGKVNPIAQFPGQGICVWGQKTLQRRKSALDRVNVRRLLLTVKKYIASASRYLVFEQNVTATRNRFLNIVNPYLAGIQERAGLYAFRVVMDESNNTPDVIDRNILYGQIWLQPTKTAEIIILDFNVLPTGAVFPTA